MPSIYLFAMSAFLLNLADSAVYFLTAVDAEWRKEKRTVEGRVLPRPERVNYRAEQNGEDIARSIPT